MSTHQTKRARLLTGSMSRSERHECHCGGPPRGPRLMCLSSLGRAQCSVDRVKLGALNGSSASPYASLDDDGACTDYVISRTCPTESVPYGLRDRPLARKKRAHPSVRS